MEIRNVVNQTLSVTEPNVFLKDRDMEQTLLPLSLQLHFDLYKRVGKKDIRIGKRKQIIYLVAQRKLAVNIQQMKNSGSPIYR